MFNSAGTCHCAMHGMPFECSFPPTKPFEGNCGHGRTPLRRERWQHELLTSCGFNEGGGELCFNAQHAWGPGLLGGGGGWWQGPQIGAPGSLGARAGGARQKNLKDEELCAFPSPEADCARGECDRRQKQRWVRPAQPRAHCRGRADNGSLPASPLPLPVRRCWCCLLCSPPRPDSVRWISLSCTAPPQQNDVRSARPGVSADVELEAASPRAHAWARSPAQGLVRHCPSRGVPPVAPRPLHLDVPCASGPKEGRRQRLANRSHSPCGPAIHAQSTLRGAGGAWGTRMMLLWAVIEWAQHVSTEFRWCRERVRRCMANLRSEQVHLILETRHWELRSEWVGVGGEGGRVACAEAGGHTTYVGGMGMRLPSTYDMARASAVRGICRSRAAGAMNNAQQYEATLLRHGAPAEDGQAGVAAEAPGRRRAGPSRSTKSGGHSAAMPHPQRHPVPASRGMGKPFMSAGPSKRERVLCTPRPRPHRHRRVRAPPAMCGSVIGVSGRCGGDRSSRRLCRGDRSVGWFGQRSGAGGVGGSTRALLGVFFWGGGRHSAAAAAGGAGAEAAHASGPAARATGVRRRASIQTPHRRDIRCDGLGPRAARRHASPLRTPPSSRPGQALHGMRSVPLPEAAGCGCCGNGGCALVVRRSPRLTPCQ